MAVVGLMIFAIATLLYASNGVAKTVATQNYYSAYYHHSASTTIAMAQSSAETRTNQKPKSKKGLRKRPKRP